jgi:periplasmic mercuric ion binding protein
MKKLLFVSIVLFACTIIFAQDKKVVETTFKVFGNCGMCKNRIEKAVKIKEVKFAKWDKDSKMLKIAFLSPDITVDSLQQRIAAVGHDTEKFKAPDSVYTNLPGCCLYRDGNKTH